jgi:hypothetical protein
MATSPLPAGHPELDGGEPIRAGGAGSPGGAEETVEILGIAHAPNVEP